LNPEPQALLYWSEKLVATMLQLAFAQKFSQKLVITNAGFSSNLKIGG